MDNIVFANKEYLWLLTVIVPIIAWYIWRQANSFGSLELSSLKAFDNTSNAWRYRFRHFLFALRMLALAALIIAFARPQSTDRWEERDVEGVDIVLALDISGSMQAEDFKPNRIEAAKSIGMEFIASRPEDRFGLVIYAGESFTQCPLTLDHAILMNLFSQVTDGMIEDGTAIGSGIATSVNRLKNSDAESKIIILLTDGVNNRGVVAPKAAAEIAQSYGIRIYGIGIGTIGKAPFPFRTPRGIQYQMVDVEIDEELLKDIADMTGGKYFRATDEDGLRQIYREIDEMEKTKLEVTMFSKPKEEFFWLLVIAASLLFIDKLLGLTIFRNTI
jgi:Ca-activated chloride channel homolog